MITETAILDRLPIGFCFTDREGRITYYNDAAAQLWGWRPALNSMERDVFTLRDRETARMDQNTPHVEPSERGFVHTATAVATRPDERRTPFIVTSAQLTDQSGQSIGTANVLCEASGRATAESRLTAILDSSDDAIVCEALDGIVTSWNASAERIFGYTAAEIVGQSVTKIIPPELHHQEHHIFAELRRGKRITPFETVRIAKDGRNVAVSLTVSLVSDSGGCVVGVCKIARDISARKEAENIQRLLLEKLNHRVKNTLATVQAIARQSLAHARSERDFVDAFTRRIQSLAKAHALLTESWMRGAYLAELVEQQALIGGAGEGSIRYSGPAIQLDPSRTIHVGLMLHELASNARRHGALSTPSGRVTVTWEVRCGAVRLLILDWQENNGPAVPSPRQTGFGTKLIRRIAHNYGGRAAIDFRAGGVACHIELPLEDEVKGATDLRNRPEALVTLLPPPPQSAVLKGKRVFVLDDEPLVALDVSVYLAAAGCEIVGPTGTIPEAKLLVERADFDVALLDLNIEGTLSEEIAQILSRKNIPFAFVTGYSRTALPAKFRQSLMLSKPFVREQLLATVEALVYLSKPSGGVIRPCQDDFESGAAVA